MDRGKVLICYAVVNGNEDLTPSEEAVTSRGVAMAFEGGISLASMLAKILASEGLPESTSIAFLQDHLFIKLDPEQLQQFTPAASTEFFAKLIRPSAHSLTLLEPGDDDQAASLAGGPFGSGHLDMSYESLVLLENVKCTAPPTLVNRLTRHVFNKEAKSLSTDCVEELCTICQVEYKDKDSYMLLPCLHTFHDICGSEWFLNHSKLCPVCKRDMTEKV